MGQKASKELHQSKGLQPQRYRGEGDAPCHVLGQSVPVSTMSSATEEVSLVEAKAGGLQTRVQVCLIIGQETSKLQAPFPRYYCKRQPPKSSSVCRQHHLLHPQPPTATDPKGVPPPSAFASLWYFQSLLRVVFVIMNTKLGNLCLLQHSHLLLKSRFFFIWEQDSCCWLQDKP